MIRTDYIKEAHGIPLVAFKSVYNFKDSYYLNPFSIKKGTELIVTDLHNHRDFEIILIEKGYGTYTISGISYDVSENDILFINPYDLHSGVISSKQDCFEYSCINFNTDFLYDGNGYADFIKKLITEELKCINYLKENKNIANCIIKVTNAYETAFPGWELTAKAYLLLIFSFLTENNCIKVNKTSEENDFVKNVFSYLENNYMNDISSRDTAQHLSYTQSYFCRMFRKHFNLSFSDYLNYYRIKKAQFLIQNGTEKVSTVASMTGFSNLSYFAKIFKKYTGINPSSYK